MPTGVYPRPSYEYQFWRRVRITDNPDECWIWQGRIQGSGHGMFYKKDGGSTSAHRIAYLLTHGIALPKHIMVCHNCPQGDNPACCNPRHLWIGTARQNNEDMARKGRAARLKGEQHPQAKLTGSKVRKLRSMYATGKYSHMDLSEVFKIDRGYVCQIIQRKYWRHV